MMAAIWDAVRELDIRYAEPPAGWGLRGQKIRTPQEVLEGRLGTCLDTTLTLAALLEQIGINSTLWMVEGHIFLGYWRENGSLGLPRPPTFERSGQPCEAGPDLVARDHAGDRRCRHPPRSRDARATPQAYLEARRDQILGITDVRAARENGISRSRAAWRVQTVRSPSSNTDRWTESSRRSSPTSAMRRAAQWLSRGWRSGRTRCST